MIYYNLQNKMLNGSFTGRLPDGRLVSNFIITEEEANKIGYYIKDESNKPSLNENQKLEETLAYSAELNKIICEYKVVDLPEEHFEFSPLKMEIDIEKRGKELGFGGLALLDSIIEQAGMTRMYKRASVLDSGDEHIIQLMGVVGQAFQWSVEEIKNLMRTWKI